MSEKRFELTKINPTINPSDTVYFIIDYENPSKNIRNLKDCVDLLNKLYEENDILKQKLRKNYIANKQYEEMKRLQKENEQLKEEIRAYPINEQYAEKIMQQNQKLRIERNNLQRENEQLKNTLNRQL